MSDPRLGRIEINVAIFAPRAIRVLVRSVLRLVISPLGNAISLPEDAIAERFSFPAKPWTRFFKSWLNTIFFVTARHCRRSKGERLGVIPILLRSKP